MLHGALQWSRAVGAVPNNARVRLFMRASHCLYRVVYASFAEVLVFQFLRHLKGVGKFCSLGITALVGEKSLAAVNSIFYLCGV